jgi:hypothetical protein
MLELIHTGVSLFVGASICRDDYDSVVTVS